jgi:hypothetical protein
MWPREAKRLATPGLKHATSSRIFSVKYLIAYTHLHQSREEMCERKACVYIFFDLLKEYYLWMKITKTEHFLLQDYASNVSV